MLTYVIVFTEMMPGGDQLQMKEAPGETLAEKTLTVMIAVVTAVIVVMTAVTESAEMTVNPEALLEVRRMVSSVATLSCL